MNIYLIGPMGSGKSTLGEKAAKVLGMEYCDMDRLVEAQAGMSISVQFERFGEAWFRDRESEAVRTVARRKNVLAATGGGVVLREANMEVLRKSGVILFIDRPLAAILADIDLSGRPLAEGSEKLTEIYNRRLPLYRKYAGYTIKNDGAKAEGVQTLIQFITEIKEKYDDTGTKA